MYDISTEDPVLIEFATGLKRVHERFPKPEWIDEDEPRYGPCEMCEFEMGDCIFLGDRCCVDCVRDLVHNEAKDDARALAEKCVIVRSEEIKPYDPIHHYAPSPEEYEGGSKDAYTPNALRAHARHSHLTNYQGLTGFLQRDCVVCGAVYSAVRDRTNKIVSKALGVALE